MKNMIFFVAAAAVSFMSADFADAAVSPAGDARLSVEAAVKPGKKTKTVVFSVNMHCHNCVKKINENISFEKGVKDMEVSLDEKTVTVTYDPSKTDENKIAAALKKLGYSVEKIEQSK